MHRLFVAIRPPRQVRDLLGEIGSDLPGARWQSDDQLHLTLRFIGEVDVHQGDDLVAALRQIRAECFSLTLQGFGTFASKGRIHTLWAGIQPCDALETLHRKIDHVITTIVPSAEKRAFVPHITLARFGGRQAPIPPIVLAPIPPACFRVGSFQLFESTLTKNGSIYSTIERYELG